MKIVGGLNEKNGAIESQSMAMRGARQWPCGQRHRPESSRHGKTRLRVRAWTLVCFSFSWHRETVVLQPPVELHLFPVNQLLTAVPSLQLHRTHFTCVDYSTLSGDRLDQIFVQLGASLMWTVQ